MLWTALLTVLVVSVASQSIEGISDTYLASLFGTPPPDVEYITSSPDEGEQPDTDDDECVCVPFFQCSNGTLNEHGQGLIDIRALNDCPDTLQQCCKHDQRVEPTEPPVFERPAFGCGLRNNHGISFSITGALEGEAHFGELPWVVALMNKEDRGLVYLCGGSLIHRQVVLTAAHCIHNLDLTTLRVRAGEWDMQATSEPYVFQERDIDRTILHEAFYKGDLRNDIALIILQSEFAPAPHIDVVCLPRQGENLDNRRCLASGWGKENFDRESQYMNILKSIELPIMPRDKCQKSFRKTRLGPKFRLLSSFICAGGEKGKDTCKGDGGGPLVCPKQTPEQERYVQAGIVAWGIGCGEEGVPGAYTSVAQFRHWVDRKMTNEGFGTKSYSIPSN